MIELLYRLAHSILIVLFAGLMIATVAIVVSAYADAKHAKKYPHATPIHPPAYVYGHLKCAVNVNKFLARLGVKGTGSAAAASFLKYKRTANPKPYDIVYNSRGKKGGHVQVYAGAGMCWNPSQRKGWVYTPCDSVWQKAKKIYLRLTL